MRDWLESLQERERIFVFSAAVFLALAVFYLAIWMPLSKGQRAMASSVVTWSEQLAELKPLLGRLQNLGSDTTPSARLDSLVVIVDRTVRQRNLANSLQRSQPTGNNVVRVEFENAAFDELVLWLGDLNQQYGLRVQSANFSNTSAENKGRVNSTVTLER